MTWQKFRALAWKEFREDMRLYGAVALVLLFLDLWVAVRPGMLRSVLIPWVFAPVLSMTFFFGLGASFQREWREQTLSFLFSLPVPRGWTYAVKLLVHYVLFVSLTFVFALLTWKLMDRYVVYVVMQETARLGLSMNEVAERIQELQKENRITFYLRLTETLALLAFLLSGVSTLYALLGGLVSRFRGVLVFLGFVAYGYGLLKFIDLWVRVFDVGIDKFHLIESGLGYALGMGVYGLLWTAALLGLFIWRAEV